MHKVKINGRGTMAVSLASGQAIIDGQQVPWDICPLPDGRLNILMGAKSYNAYLVALDKQKKELTLRINGVEYRVTVQEPIDLLLQKMGLNMNLAKKAQSIKAPMPGLVLNIMVEEGQALKKGDPVLILEAMKMENVFKAPEDAVVKSIKIKAGQAVEKGAVLIELA
ncbi:MAG TPA: biotin/lipoyl-containing protein [Edaphocola sp.]|nr:biotin/lipoyl-containing protein [Edaphocola sp.]